MEVNLRHAGERRQRPVVEGAVQLLGVVFTGVGRQHQGEFMRFHRMPDHVVTCAGSFEALLSYQLGTVAAMGGSVGRPLEPGFRLRL